VRAALPLAACLLLAGCGIPAEDDPREVAPPRGADPAASAVPWLPESGAERERLCLIRDGKLVRVVRRVPVRSTVAEQLAHLMAGPSDTEREDDLTSALTGGIPVTGARIVNGEVQVEVGVAAGGEDTARTDDVLAFGQIVCTLTTRPEVIGVSFLQGGRRIGVPRADGSLSPGPLTGVDYAALIVPD
jgi:hypothetical protein